MYIILVYDVNIEHVSKVNKYLKRYLLWRQNSVFEGELSEAMFNSMLKGINKIIDLNYDSVIIYTFKVKTYTDILKIGKEKGSDSNII